jgi:predicted metal-binding membrane protein
MSSSSADRTPVAGASTAASAQAALVTFVTICAIVFGASLAATRHGVAVMSGGHRMAMAGEDSMPMSGTPDSLPTQLFAFLAMWTVMMIAMMLPSLAPQLWRYRRFLAASGARRPGQAALLAGLGYFTTWTGCGVLAFAAAAAVAAVRMHLPPLDPAGALASGMVMLLAGALQFTAWKQRELRCCQEALVTDPAAAARPTAWRRGLRLGLQCNRCCAGLTAVLLTCGIMDPVVMLLLTAAITLERLAHPRAWAVRGIGLALLGTGLWVIGRVVVPGLP